jgi:hypothetical protein
MILIDIQQIDFLSFKVDLILPKMTYSKEKQFFCVKLISKFLLTSVL